MLKREDINKLAELARINVPDAEKEVLAKDLDSVLGYVSEIKELTSKGDIPEADYGFLVNINLREDDEPHEAGVYTEDILNEAPETEDGFIKVRKIL